jgi:hypothetical protein
MVLRINVFAGLGNQLFMIFATLSYAIEKNIKYAFLSHMTRTTNGTVTYWDTLLDAFKNNIDENVKSDISEYENVYKEPFFHYAPFPDTLADKDTVLQGYFQSYKYFENNFARIKELMNLDSKIESVKNENKHLFRRKTIAMHFRFGDYMNLQHYHCVKRPHYYIHALRGLERDLKTRGENIADYNILYFSQLGDEAIVAEFMKVITGINDDIDYTFIKVSDNIPDWKQMLLMSCCDHFIIANSSFSWFGAYFSTAVNKIVYRPRVWFGPANRSNDTKDLCPPEWIVVNV